MRSYRKTIIATAVAASLAVLTACVDNSDDEYEQKFKSNVVAQATMDQSNIEKDAAYRLTRELRAVDSSIQSVDPVIVNGQRTIEISRSREDGSVEVWKMDPEKYADMMASATSQGPAAPSSEKLTQTPKDDSSAFGSAFGGAMTGAIVGSVAGQLIGNMFNSNQGVTRGFSNYSQYAQYNGEQRRAYTSSLSSMQAARYDRERERERRGGGGYVSPFIGSAASTHAAANGQSGYKYGGVSAGAPSRAAPSSVSSGGRSSSSGTAFSSGARGSASVSS